MTARDDAMQVDKDGDDGSSKDGDAGKVDPITSLQDAVDGLSLAMFEALRGLRDAVAPESGNLGGNANNNQNNNNNGNNGNGTGNNAGQDGSEPDFEDFWQSYRSGDEDTVAYVHKVNGGQPPKKREDYVRIHAKIEMEKDAGLVSRLANSVLQKSADIDDQVERIPGMHRTQAQQMERIEELLTLNQEAISKLEESYEHAANRQALVRRFIRDNTCAALAITEEID